MFHAKLRVLQLENAKCEIGKKTIRTRNKAICRWPLSYASCRGVNPALSFTINSCFVPACTSTVHASTFPLSTAQCKGVQPNIKNNQQYGINYQINQIFGCQNIMAAALTHQLCNSTRSAMLCQFENYNLWQEKKLNLNIYRNFIQLCLTLSGNSLYLSYFQWWSQKSM